MPVKFIRQLANSVDSFDNCLYAQGTTAVGLGLIDVSTYCNLHHARDHEVLPCVNELYTEP